MTYSRFVLVAHVFRLSRLGTRQGRVFSVLPSWLLHFVDVVVTSVVSETMSCLTAEKLVVKLVVFAGCFKKECIAEENFSFAVC